MKFLVFGASGSGTTTLGIELAKRIDFIHLDSDDYYWEKTNPPFKKKITLSERNEKLKKDFLRNENVVLSGSMVSWGKEWETAFDFAVFLRLNSEERMRRLQKREEHRYGKLLSADNEIKKNSEAFLEWAKQYDNPDFDGRSIRLHKNWMRLLNCEVMELDGSVSLQNNVNEVIQGIKKFSDNHF